jgi:heme-degrading monooxygenase HmoA
MILVIVHHQVKPGLADAAVQRIDDNGTRMAQVPGYLFRYRLVAKDDPLRISTVTGWTGEECYRNWISRRDASRGGAPAESPYLRVENSIHLVEQTDDRAAAAPRRSGDA